MRRREFIAMKMTVFLSFSIYLMLQCLYVKPAFAIVNLDNLHLSSGETGTSGLLKLNVSGDQGNNKNLNINAATIMNYRTINTLSFFQIEYSYGESFDKKNKDKSFIHIRHIKEFVTKKAWELFSQVEQNSFARLNYRGLVGAGLRFDLGESDLKQRIYFGTGAFYSQEELSNAEYYKEDKKQNYIRLNFYLIYKKDINDNVSLFNTTYLQPVVDTPEDFRALLVAGLKSSISKKLYLVISLEGAYDSRPPQTVDRKDISYFTGVEYNF